ncbi:DUF3093 family protein [Microbacterium sp. C7(2022)]|uniref:DUF3093 family protein n=1 Tax=Microbacterium sp. C7(2022) TaxID=2992759 RepID=UPI00237B8F7B|nr:DUF3093 family protein [Microbacterium sp. C7(2022)]MDE0545472.1 DUF3093 domain-containing protein [Microbacterium sp. C7(2022)]
MQNSASHVGTGTYRERLGPSLWTVLAAAVVSPMAALVFVAINPTVALAIGAFVAVGVIGAMIAFAPVVSVTDHTLRAGRAHIDVAFTGEPVIARGEDARHARGPGLDHRSWHLIRGGIEPVVIIPIIDPDDPAPAWVISSRTPERLAAALRRSHITQRTPRR